MIDGINTGMLPVDVFHHAYTLGVDITPQPVYVNTNGLIHGFSDRVDTDTGEIRKICTLRGSLHKYANAGIHNADSFRMSDLCRVFTELKQDYGIKPDCTRLLSVEFGVNLKLPYSPQRIIQAARMYKGFQFAPLGNIGIEHKGDAFKLKIYDKGKQCKLHEFENVLRIEIKAECNYLKKRGVYVPMLGDLLSPDVWQRFETILLDAVENVTLVEATQIDGLTKKESDLIRLFVTGDWRDLDRKQRYKKKKQLDGLIQRYGIDDLKAGLKRMIIRECEQLRDYNTEKGDVCGIFNPQKIKEHNNMRNKEALKKVTFAASPEPHEKRQKGDVCGFKMKGANVTKTLEADTPPTASDKQCIISTKISYTPMNTIKSRGKPLDIEEFNTG